MAAPSPFARPPLQDIDTVLFDCDGVLWRGNEMVPGADHTLTELRNMVCRRRSCPLRPTFSAFMFPFPRSHSSSQPRIPAHTREWPQGKQVLFVTNNSAKSRAQYLSKFSGFGISAAVHEVFSSAFATAAFLRSRNFAGKVYIIGDVGIALELDEVGIRHIDSWELFGSSMLSRDELESMPIDAEIGAVVVGIDTQFSYTKMAYAVRCLHANPNVLLIATNTDATLPVPGGVLPGGGSVVAAVSTAAQRAPLVMGKPEPLLLDIAIAQCKLDPARTLMVGDKIDTDILFGLRGGLKTLLVLSGVTTRAELDRSVDIRPHYVLSSVADML